MCFHSPNIHLKERHLTIEPQKKKKNIGTNVQRLYGVHGHLFSITLSN